MAAGSSTEIGDAASTTMARGLSARTERRTASIALGRRGVDLVDHHHVGAPQVGLARVVRGLVPGPVGVRHHDLQPRPVEGQVVVAAVPDDDLRLLLRLGQDGPVVHARVDHAARRDVRLVLLPLLDGAAVPVQVLHDREALDALPRDVAVRHGVADRHHLAALVAQDADHAPRGLALAAARAHRAHRDHRHAGLEHAGVRPDQPEIGPRGQDLRGQCA